MSNIFKIYPLFRIQGIPVRMNWSVPLSFVVFTTLFYFYIQYVDSYAAIYEWPFSLKLATSIAVVLLFYFSLLLHGLLRASTASARGYKVKDVTIFSLGVASNFNRNITNFKHVFWITLAGPMANLLILALLFALAVAAIDNLTLSLIFTRVFYINIIITVLGLMLIVPIRAGRLLRTFVWSVSRSRYLASKISIRVGQLLGVVLMLMITPLIIGIVVSELVQYNVIAYDLSAQQIFTAVNAYLGVFVSLTGSATATTIALIVTCAFGFYVLDKASIHDHTLKRSQKYSEATRDSKILATLGQSLGLVLYSAVIVSFSLWGVSHTYDSWFPEATNPLPAYTESEVVIFASIISGLISIMGVYVFYEATVHKLKLRRSNTDQSES